MLTSLVTFPLAPVPVYAHPGRTDSSGGHTCRTNCARWGYGQGEYHSHGGGGSSGGSSESTNTAPVIESNQSGSRQRFMEYRNTVLTGTPTNIPTRGPTRRPTQMPTPTVTLTPLPTATPSLTPTQKKKARPIQAATQAPQQQGFFDWVIGLFRGN